MADISRLTVHSCKGQFQGFRIHQTKRKAYSFYSPGLWFLSRNHHLVLKVSKSPLLLGLLVLHAFSHSR
jgi:hypothetical protein